MATLVPDSGQYQNITRDQLTGDQFFKYIAIKCSTTN